MDVLVRAENTCYAGAVFPCRVRRPLCVLRDFLHLIERPGNLANRFNVDAGLVLDKSDLVSDLLRRLRCLVRQQLHFCSNDGEPLAGFTRARPRTSPGPRPGPSLR